MTKVYFPNKNRYNFWFCNLIGMFIAQIGIIEVLLFEAE